MKKRLTSLLLASVLAGSLLLTGCHGSRNSTSFAIPDSFDESEKYEITFWAKNDTNKNQTAIYNQAIEDFEKLYPNITVTMRLYTDYGDIYNDVITNIQTQTTPNVCITYPDHIATYMTGNNVVVPLDSLMSDEKYGLGGSEVKFDSPSQDEIVPQFLDECKIQGNYYALPYMRSTEALYVNKTYVEKLGYTLPEVPTWDWVWEVSEAATARNDDGTYAVNGQNVLIPFIYKSTDNMLIQMLKQKGGGYSTDAGEIEIFNDTTRDILEEIAPHVKSGAFSTFAISGYPANFLDAGQCLFAVDSTAGATWMGTDAPLSDISADKVVDFETAVLPIPQYDADNPQMISQGPSICVFNKEDSGEVLASWLFAQYLLSDDVQIAYSETEGYVPVTTRAQESDEYKDYLAAEGTDGEEHYTIKIEAAKLLLDNIENTFTTPVFNGSASLRSAAGQMVETVAKSAKRKKEVDDAFIDSVFSDVTSLYRLDQIQTQSGASSGQAASLGPMPAASKALLIILIVTWACIALVWGTGKYKKRKQHQ